MSKKKKIVCEYVEGDKKCRKSATEIIKEYGEKTHNFCTRHAYVWLIVDNEFDTLSIREEVKEYGLDFEEIVKVKEERMRGMPHGSSEIREVPLMSNSPKIGKIENVENTKTKQELFDGLVKVGEDGIQG